jgi:hypothetical protein
MFTFAHHTDVFRRIGLALLLCLLNVFIACLPPFQTGIWVQTEPTVLVIFITTALSALWLLMGTVKRWLIPPPTLSPLLLCLLAWVVWQVIVTCFAQLPLRSWFGPPQTGEGTAMSIAIIVMIFLISALWQSANCRTIILYTSAISLFIQCALHFYYPMLPGNPYTPDRWVPAQWPSYLPFIGGYLWVIAWISGVIKTQRHYWLMVIAMVVLLMDSSNVSARIIFSLSLVATSAARWMTTSPTLNRYVTPNRSWRIAMMAACVAPIMLVVVSPVFPEPGSDENPKGLFSIFSRINDGIGSRVILDRVSVAAMLHEPSRWLVGNGWGTYTDDLFKYGLVDGVYTYKNGTRAPNWFLVEGTSHHSHNQPVEALMALGLLGMALWYAFPMLAIAALPASYFWTCGPMIVALTELGHFWFQLPQCFPYQALYMAILLYVCTQGERPLAKTFYKLWAFAFAILALTIGYSACLQYRAMMHADQLHYALLNDNYKNYSEAWVAEDLRFGGDRWATSARFYSTDATEKSSKKQLNDNILGWYSYLIHTAHKAAQDPGIGARAAIVELRLQYYLFGSFNDPLFDTLRHEQTELFEDSIIRALGKAPLRDDYTSFFLLNLQGYTKNDSARQMQILNRILAVSPNHRGALWLLGRMLVTTPGKEELGRKMLQKAIALHIERAFPVSDSELESVRRSLSPSVYQVNP